MLERIIEFSVPPGAKEGRADKVFAAEFNDVSRARLQRAFDAGQVTFDGKSLLFYFSNFLVSIFAWQ